MIVRPRRSLNRAIIFREYIAAGNLKGERVRTHSCLKGRDGSTMNGGSDVRMARLETRRKLAVLSLKRCPLCGAVNAVANAECFVCCWRGDFERDPDSVDEGLGELLIRCPELMEAMIGEPEPKK